MTFTKSGTYLLRLTANDTQYTAASDVTIPVTTPINPAPVVSAGQDQTVTASSATVTLAGTATDALLLTYQWTELSGPAQVTIASPTSLVTQASFPQLGTYVLQLAASDGQLTATATVRISLITACVQGLSGIRNWWPAEGTANDIQGTANGTINGGVTFSAGKVGQAFSFNGTDSFVALPANFFPFPQFGTSTVPFSFTTWFKTTQSGVIFGQQDAPPFGTANGAVPGLYVGTDGKLYSKIFWSGSISQTVSAARVNDGAFHHVAVTYDGANEVVYLDGAQIGARPYTQAYFSDYPALLFRLAMG